MKKASWNHESGPGRPKQTITNKIMDVYGLLPKDGSKIKTKDLKKRADEKNIGYNTLYKYLDKLLEHGFIEKGYVEENSYPPQVQYQRVAPFVLFPTETLHKLIREQMLILIEYLELKGDQEGHEKMLNTLAKKLRESYRMDFEALDIIRKSAFAEAANKENPEERWEFFEISTRLHEDNLLKYLFTFAEKTPEIFSEAIEESWPGDEVKEYFSSERAEELEDFTLNVAKEALPEMEESLKKWAPLSEKEKISEEDKKIEDKIYGGEKGGEKTNG